MPRVYQIEAYAMIGSVKCQTLSVDVSLGCYGSVGHAVASFSIKQLNALGINPMQLSGAINIFFNINGAQVHMFSGSITQVSIHYVSDEVSLFCRDGAGVLVDEKLNIADLNYQNQTASELITQICAKYNITVSIAPNLSNLFVPQGSIFNYEAVYAQQPKEAWTIVNNLARSIGAHVYMTPDNVLNIGASVETNNTATWQGSPTSEITNPILDLKVDTQLERNGSFIVNVYSYDNQTLQTILAQALVLNEQVPTSVGLQLVNPGFYTGQSAASTIASITDPLGNIGVSRKYDFHFPGLTQQQAELEAQSIAHNISREMLIIQCVIDGNTSIRPYQQLSIVDNSSNNYLSGLAGNSYNITSVDHSLRVAQGGASSQGYITSMKLLNVPPEILATSMGV